MKKRLFALAVTLILTFAFSANCFAAVSPTETEIPTEKENPSTTSPKTGVGVAGAFVAVITASGVALTAKKKFSDAE